MVENAKTYVGIGFGPIQSGLFLYEALGSGHFSRLVVAEVDRAVVKAVRANGGACTVNIAGKTRIDQASVAPIEIYDPASAEDRQALIQAIAQADELATCLPSVDFYDRGGSVSPASLLAEGLAARREKQPAILYAAENHNHAAELLAACLIRHGLEAPKRFVQILNTVIGKMSGVVTDPDQIREQRLIPLTPTLSRAVLVEEFNRILVSRVGLAGVRRGIDAFIEKDNLLPYEEAKLYGHNAVHALIGYLADMRGLSSMAEAGRTAGIMDIARQAFLEESGRALVDKHGGLGDPLFTPKGFKAYAEDLLNRMVRPTLNDPVSRICRDSARKLGPDDRFFGTMRMVLSRGIQPARMAMGAAAALIHATRSDAPNGTLTKQGVAAALKKLWAEAAPPEADTLIALTASHFCLAPCRLARQGA